MESDSPCRLKSRIVILKFFSRDKTIKCDRCSVTIGNYHYAPGKWRCPACIWKELNEVSAELEQFKRAYGDCLGLRGDSQG